jgi:hypothetical protein
MSKGTLLMWAQEVTPRSSIMEGDTEGHGELRGLQEKGYP